MKTVLETITPTKAVELLKKNSRNRGLTKAKVKRFVRDLISGAWTLTHQSIGVAPSFIVDGQHRLVAVKESGVPIEMMVTYYDTDEEAEKAVMAVDITDKRTAGDMLEIAGVMVRGTGRAAVAITRTLHRMAMGLEGVENQGQPTVTEIQQIYKRDKSHIDWAVQATSDSGNKKRFSHTLRTALVIAHMLDAEKTEKFIEQILSMDFPVGSVAQVWVKAETEGKFTFSPSGSSGEKVVYNALRLLQCIILEEQPPKKFPTTPSAFKWFRTQIEKKRKRELAASEQLEKMQAHPEIEPAPAHEQ